MSTFTLQPGRLIIGKAGQTEPIQLIVSVRDWKTQYPNGTPGMLCVFPDGRRWPVVVEVSGDNMVATLDDDLTRRPGTYRYTPTWTENGQVMLGRQYECVLLDSPARGHGPRWEDTPSWATQIYRAAEDVVDAKTDAEAAQAAAEDARDKALAAKQDAQAAKTDAETAKGLADDAQEAAEAARDRAEAAATLAQEHSMGFNFSDGVLTLTPITDD